ncbi:hypothetical protein H072_1855 [Dactylellina haptotyla CBS 200.50]|uniref:Nephrocystin 3-like N-terminal domain-containing protein n=1 Tax=Dactylellina haptotyla (strain CBS 200.50) TaxID=1284197 RepID=S8BXE3_DACHA|nr:hypothetical protein H072_1855 [Dactylellina haptotyla CBS 200.50]
MLDEQHMQLPTNAKDENTYTLGRVGSYNIVIARPASYGTNSAASTVANMVRSFQNLRFVLMVGIGGGAPGPPVPKNSREDDIRLGDVVVGYPKGSHSGVLQYDMGKLESYGQFTIRSHLNKPPRALLTAVGTLQSEHDFRQGKMVRYLQTALECMHAKGTKNLNAYYFPGRNNDQLFKANYHHNETTMDCSACDPNQIEKRVDRDSDEPVVHYGLIASGNMVMRSAQRRNELRDNEGVACFEMEAAGLMDDFPCLVIRGICDYSDDHKNDLWQPYAALVAAAYAKDLLRVTQLEEVEKMEGIANIIKGPTESIFSMQKDKQLDEIFRWLWPLEPRKRHQDVTSLRLPGTGRWFLEEPNFLYWYQNTNMDHILCCSGIPGAGKTVITSQVIDFLTKRSTDSGQQLGLAYIYCDYNDQATQAPISLIGTILGQLISDLPFIPKEVISLYEQKHRGRKLLEQGDVEAMLLHICRQYSMVYICIDALDECQHRESLLKSLKKLLPLIKLFITGRPHIPGIINQYFTGGLKITIEANKEDVKRFITMKIDEDWRRDKYLMEERLKQEILHSVETKSQKMLNTRTQFSLSGFYYY